MGRPSKPKYKTAGLGKNKEIKKQRNKPLPIGLMANAAK